MAKPLRKPQPTSSVDKFFNRAALDAALEHHEEQATEPPLEQLETYLDEPPSAQPRPTAVQPPSLPVASPRPAKIVGEIGVTRTPVTPAANARGELIDRKREFRLTKSTDETLEELVTLYRHSTGADLTRSHVLRAIIKAIDDAMPTLRREAEKIGPLKRPSNARGFEDRRDEFELSITSAFRKGMRG